MNRVKKGLDNQAIGLLPLLLFMFLDNYFSYLLSFIIGVTFCFVCIFLFQVLTRCLKYGILIVADIRRCGGIGRHRGLKIPR